MSILSDLLGKKITFSQAVTETETWAEQLIAHDPTVTAVTGDVVTEIKQGASNAVDLADSALGAIIAPASKALEATLETALAAATKGLSTGLTYNPQGIVELETPRHIPNGPSMYMGVLGGLREFVGFPGKSLGSRNCWNCR